MTLKKSKKKAYTKARKVITQHVPCNGCDECCRGELIFIHPELGDKASQYKTKVVNGRYALQHQDNDDCVYLIRGKGCSIYERRPAVCRELDCARWLNIPNVHELVSKGLIKPSQLAAAYKRIKRHFMFESETGDRRRTSSRSRTTQTGER